MNNLAEWLCIYIVVITRSDQVMKRERHEEIWDFEHELAAGGGPKLILGLDGGTTNTICICMPIIPSTSSHHSPPVYARAVAGCSNHNSVGGTSLSLNVLSD